MNKTIFFILEEVKETILKRNRESIANLFYFNSLNIKLYNAQLNKLKSGLKNDTEVTLNLSSSMISDSNDETNFAHKLLITDGQVSGLCKGFVNNITGTIKSSKTQLSKIMQSGGFLVDLLGHY